MASNMVPFLQAVIPLKLYLRAKWNQDSHSLNKKLLLNRMKQEGVNIKNVTISIIFPKNTW